MPVYDNLFLIFNIIDSKQVVKLRYTIYSTSVTRKEVLLVSVRYTMLNTYKILSAGQVDCPRAYKFRWKLSNVHHIKRPQKKKRL